MSRPKRNRDIDKVDPKKGEIALVIFMPHWSQIRSANMAHTRFEDKNSLVFRPAEIKYLSYCLFVFYSYLRSIAYREFSRLVYSFLGNKRIPLPACAYTAIRKQFPVGTDETYTGFELDEDD